MGTWGTQDLLLPLLLLQPSCCPVHFLAAWGEGFRPSQYPGWHLGHKEATSLRVPPAVPTLRGSLGHSPHPTRNHAGGSLWERTVGPGSSYWERQTPQWGQEQVLPSPQGVGGGFLGPKEHRNVEVHANEPSAREGRAPARGVGGPAMPPRCGQHLGSSHSRWATAAIIPASAFQSAEITVLSHYARPYH